MLSVNQALRTKTLIIAQQIPPVLQENIGLFRGAGRGETFRISF